MFVESGVKTKDEYAKYKDVFRTLSNFYDGEFSRK